METLAKRYREVMEEALQFTPEERRRSGLQKAMKELDEIVSRLTKFDTPKNLDDEDDIYE